MWRSGTQESSQAVGNLVSTVIIAVLALALLLTVIGCSHTKKIGQVGNIEFYKVQSTSLVGPTVNVIVSKPVGNDDNVKVEGSFGGNGIGPAVVGAGGQVGAAATLRPTTVRVTGGTATSNAEGGDADASSRSDGHKK